MMAAFLTGLSVCFLNAGSGKTAAITALSKMSGISISDIAAFGDDSNDVEMLKLCGIGVAVANAVPEAFESADEVTLSNDEDGVAKWKHRLLAPILVLCFSRTS